MNQPKISLYKNLNDKSPLDVPIDLVLFDIRGGRWQDIVLELRAKKATYTADEYKRKKEQLQCGTFSGTFSHSRKANDIQRHSGILLMDLDCKDNPSFANNIEREKDRLRNDPYIYSAFVSCGGNGLAILAKINGNKHKEAFLGFEQYLFEKYGLISDPSGKDVSRLRFVSFDPYLHINEDSIKFDKYPPPVPKALNKLQAVVWVENDFAALVNEIVVRRIDLTSNYHEWINIGFAIYEKFGDGGLDYFLQISQFHPGFDYDRATRKYQSFKSGSQQGAVTIASLYWYAKKAGLQVMSDQTRLIISTATLAKKGGRKKESAIKILSEQDGIAADLAAPIVDQVFDMPFDIETDESEQALIERYIRDTYPDLHRNSIDMYVYSNGKKLYDEDFSFAFTEARKVFPKISYDIIFKTMTGAGIRMYNPFEDFLLDLEKNYPDTGGIENILKLIRCIDSDTGDENWRIYFITKWLIGIIEAMAGSYTKTMLVLCGVLQGTGKTEFFRRLLPAPLKQWYGEGPMSTSKDYKLLMTQRLVLMSDEMDNNISSKSLKSLLSTDIFSLRSPYKASNMDYRRTAVMCGTSNTEGVIDDPSGMNRRTIPVKVKGINHVGYNSIDKSELLAEAYWLWKKGDRSEIVGSDIVYLNASTEEFKSFTIEHEMVQRFFRPPVENEQSENITSTDAKIRMEALAGIKNLDKYKIADAFNAQGFVRKSVRAMPGLGPRYGYDVIQVKFSEGTQL